MADTVETKEPSQPPSKSELFRQRLEQRFQLDPKDPTIDQRVAAGFIDAEQKAPGPKDAEADLTEKITELARAEQALKDIINKGDYKSLSIEDKGKYWESYDKARFFAQHAFGEAANIAELQRRLEERSTAFVKEKRRPLERTRAALTGELTLGDTRGRYSDEFLKLDEYMEQIENGDLAEEDKAVLLGAIDARIDAIKGIEDDVATIAKEKMIPPDQKQERVDAYQASAARYRANQRTLNELLTRLQGYGTR